MSDPTRTAILLGSNIEPERNIGTAMRRIAGRADITVVATSDVYASPSIGPDGEPDGRPPFHNAVMMLHTFLGPLDLRSVLRAIENDMGRVRDSDKFSPRPIDLDVIYYGIVGLQTEELTLPDPEALVHAHVAVPLADVAPDWRPHGGSVTAAQAASSHTLTRASLS